ncbi:MAG: thioesterase family protein, partial [Rudaea sp.]
IRTWISSMSRIRADRNYLVRRVRDGQVLARATANWVYLDSKSMFPTRIDPAIVAMFSDVEPPALPERSSPRWLCVPERPLQSTVLRDAQYYEADGARHTNNSVYVEWLEEAVRQTLLAHGFALPLDGPLSLWFHRCSLEYISAARPGDKVEISTRLTGRGRSAGRWVQEIRRAGTGERVAQSECITLWRGKGDGVQSWENAGRIAE